MDAKEKWGDLMIAPPPHPQSFISSYTTSRGLKYRGTHNIWNCWEDCTFAFKNKLLSNNKLFIVSSFVCNPVLEIQLGKQIILEFKKMIWQDLNFVLFVVFDSNKNVWLWFYKYLNRIDFRCSLVWTTYVLCVYWICNQDINYINQTTVL